VSTKDWLEKDFYRVLGVSKDADADAIKKAYRKLARQNHPDVKPGDAEAEKRFKEVSEAHEVLSDKTKRKQYDDERRLFGSGLGGFRFPGGAGGGVNMEDLFRNAGSGDQGIGDLFGGLFAGGNRARTGRAGPRRGSDIEGEVTINFVDAADGVTVPMRMVSDAPCKDCHGTGARAGTMPKVCPDCEGSGMTASTLGGFAVSEPCRQCRGRGMIVDDPCKTCHGSGRGQSTRTMQVRIPPGVSNEQKIRLKGKGGPGENGGAAGDLYVLVNVRPHKVFGRKDSNLTVTVPVTFAEAALGSEIKVPTLNGPAVMMKLPPGTANGRTLRIRGKGAARSDGTRGDLLVTIEVVVPQGLSNNAKEALQAYRSAVDEPDPRAELFAAARG